MPNKMQDLSHQDHKNHFGTLGLNSLLQLYFLATHSRALEGGSFQNRSADFLYMLILGATSLTAAACFGVIESYFMGPSLCFMITYVWGRRHSYARLVFMVGLAMPSIEKHDRLQCRASFQSQHRTCRGLCCSFR